MENTINMNAITLEDCIENYTKKNISTIINDGIVIGFTEEN